MHLSSAQRVARYLKYRCSCSDRAIDIVIFELRDQAVHHLESLRPLLVAPFASGDREQAGRGVIAMLCLYRMTQSVIGLNQYIAQQDCRRRLVRWLPLRSRTVALARIRLHLLKRADGMRHQEPPAALAAEPLLCAASFIESFLEQADGRAVS